jgi:hypothetical protein
VCNATLAEAYAQELQTPWLALSSKRQGVRPSGIAVPRGGEKWRSDLVESVIGEAYCASVLQDSSNSSSSNKSVRLDSARSGMVQRLVCCCLRSERFLQCVHGGTAGGADEMMHANTFDCLQGSVSDSDSDSDDCSESASNSIESSDSAASIDSCAADATNMQLQTTTAVATDRSKDASVSTAKRRAAEQRRQHLQNRDHVCDISDATAAAAQCTAPSQWQQQYTALLSSFDQKLSTSDEQQQQQQRRLLYAHYGHSLIKLKVTSFLYAALSSAAPRELTFKRQACLRAATLCRAVELLTASSTSNGTAAARVDIDAAAAAVLRLRCAVSTAALQYGDFMFAAKVAVLLLALSGAVHTDAVAAFAATTAAGASATAAAAGAEQLAEPLAAVLQLLTRPPWTVAQLPQISQAMQRLFGCAAASTTADANNNSKRARAGSVESLRCSTPPLPMTEQEACYSRRIAAMQKSSRRLLARLAAMDYIAEYELLLTRLVLTEVTSDMHTSMLAAAVVNDSSSSAAVQCMDSVALPQPVPVSALSAAAAVVATGAAVTAVAVSSSTTEGVLTVCISDPFQRQVLHCLCELHGFRSVSRVVATANSGAITGSGSVAVEQQCKAVCITMVNSSEGWPALPLISASALQEQLG